MKYAVISLGGKQYKVSEGDVVNFDQLPVKADETYTFKDVLLFVEDAKRKIGTPTLSDVTVSGKVLGNKKDEKIRVGKFKAKVRYRRVMGFRANLTTIQIEKISAK
ncbi:MAG TPA: 50S ribosomal protein L21 [Patescibacteria group bacterium]